MVRSTFSSSLPSGFDEPEFLRCSNRYNYPVDADVRHCPSSGFFGELGGFVTEALVRFLLSLGGRGLVLQPAFLDCLFLDLLSHLQDFGTAAVVDIGRGQIAQALVVAMVIVVIDEGANLSFEVSG
jgi:hypothetical protein